MVYVPPRSRQQPPIQAVAPLASRPPAAPAAPKPAAAPAAAAAKPPKPATPKKQNNFVEGKVIRRDREKTGRLIDRVDITEVLGLDYQPDPRQIFAALAGGRHG